MSARPGTLDVREAAQWARARARAARDHHPDRGGDVHTYLEALHQVDVRYGVAAAGTARVQVHQSRALSARLGRTVRAARGLTRALMNRLPRRLRPGRTYIDL